jgi:acetate---CoA ligase (ADP-forming)
VSELSTPIQAKIMKLLPSYGTARHPIDVTPQGLNSGGLQRSIDLLAASDEVDAVLVVLSLSSDVRMPFKEAEPKPVIAAQTKPIVFYSYTLPSDFARRTLAESHVVVLSGLTHVAVALRQLTRYARFKLAAPVDATLLPARDLFARLTAPALSEHDSKVLLREAASPCRTRLLVTEKSGLDAATARIGLPLAIKLQSRDLARRSEVGGVRLNVMTKGEAFIAWQALSTMRAGVGRTRRSRALWSRRW